MILSVFLPIGHGKAPKNWIEGCRLAVSGVICCSPGGVVLGRDGLTCLFIGTDGSDVIFAGFLKWANGLC